MFVYGDSFEIVKLFGELNFKLDTKLKNTHIGEEDEKMVTPHIYSRLWCAVLD